MFADGWLLGVEHCSITSVEGYIFRAVAGLILRHMAIL